MVRMFVPPQFEIPLSGISFEGGFGVDCQTPGPLGMGRRPVDVRIIYSHSYSGQVFAMHQTLLRVEKSWK